MNTNVRVNPSEDKTASGQACLQHTQGHSQTVSEEAVGLTGNARLAVVDRMVPDGTTSVVSATTCAKSIYYIYI